MTGNFRRRRWLAAGVVVLGVVILVVGVLYSSRPARRADFAGEPVLIFLREIHTHLLPPEYSPLAAPTAGLAVDGPQLTLPPALWEQWHPGPLVLLRRLEHLDQVVAEGLHVSRGQTLQTSLAPWPTAVTGYDGFGAPTDLRPLIAPRLVGGTLDLQLADDSGTVMLTYRDVALPLQPGENRYVLKAEGGQWLAVPSGTEQRVFGRLLETGQPITALAITNLGPWPQQAVTQSGALADEQ